MFLSATPYSKSRADCVVNITFVKVHRKLVTPGDNPLTPGVLWVRIDHSNFWQAYIYNPRSKKLHALRVAGDDGYIPTNDSRTPARVAEEIPTRTGRTWAANMIGPTLKECVRS